MIDDETLTSSYLGHTVFSLFENNKKVYQLISESISSRQFAEEQDDEGNSIQHRMLRKLAIIMNTPILKKKDDAASSVAKNSKDNNNLQQKTFLTEC